MPTLTAILNATQFQAGARQVAASTREMMSSVRSAEGVMASFTAKLGRLGSNLGVDFTIGGAFSSLVDSATQLQKYETTMTSFTGDLKSAREELQYVADTADKFGVSIQGIAAPFSKFAAAATDFSKAEIHKVFEAFVTASSGLQLNMQEVNGVFLALQQIVSKGKLSMEELRLQLAERIPGAMTLAAQAAGMSMQEFESAVRNGTVNMREWMVDFADLITEKFGTAADVARNRLQAALQRLSNAFFLLRGNVMETSGASQNLTNLFNSITTKFFKSEAVTNAFSNAIGRLTLGFSTFIEGIDDEKITKFADGLNDIIDKVQNVSGEVFKSFTDFLGDESQWKSVVESTKAVADLGGEIMKIVKYILALPGDLVDLGMLGYVVFGKSTPGKIIAGISLVYKKMNDEASKIPAMQGDDSGGSYFERMLDPQKMIGMMNRQNKEISDASENKKITLTPEVVLQPKKVTYHKGFEAELAHEMSGKNLAFVVSNWDIEDTTKLVTGITAAYQEIEKTAKATWDKVKGYSTDNVNDNIAAAKNIAQVYNSSNSEIANSYAQTSNVLKQQEDAARSYANVFKTALATDGSNAVRSFISTLGNVKNALDKGMNDAQILKLSNGLKGAAKIGVEEFTKMGKSIDAVLNDIVKKEAEVAAKIKGIYADIANVHKTASDARFDLEQKNRSAAEQYQATLRRTNELLLQSKTLSDQAKGTSGAAKDTLLKESNNLLSQALGLSKELNATEDNKVTKAQAYKDQLSIINEYESRSVENLKQLATAAENELVMWQNVKKEFENISTVVDKLVTTFSSALKLDISADDAITQIDGLVSKLKEINMTPVTDGLTTVEGGVKQIGDTWEDVLKQVEENHSASTKKVIEDLSAIEKAVKRAFADAGGKYTVSVSGKALGGKIGLADGGRIPGYGGGDGPNVDTERGEYVINKHSTSYYGDDFLDDVNKRRINRQDVQSNSKQKDSQSKDSTGMMNVNFVMPNNQVIPTYMKPLDAMMIKDQNRKAARFSS